MKKLMLLPLLLLQWAPLEAKEVCSEEWVCVSTEEKGGEVILAVENRKPWPVTVTVSTRSRNLRSDKSGTQTATVGGGDRLTLARYQRRDANRRHQLRFWYDWVVGRGDARHDDDVLYQLPYASGKRYGVLQGFKSRFSHKGLEEYAVDFRMAVGTPVHAARGGVVVDLEESHNKGCWEKGCGRYANYVTILHDDGTTGEYYHLKQKGVLVEVGDSVEAGQKIALSGNTGHTTMPHLHFAVYRPASWGRTQSLPFRFTSQEGTITRPRSGRGYRAN